MGNQSVISIEAVIDYIESHLDGKLELETVAEAVHYSKYHLHRLCTETVGMTIHDYVQRRQLTEAAKLLVFSDVYKRQVFILSYQIVAVGIFLSQGQNSFQIACGNGILACMSPVSYTHLQIMICQMTAIILRHVLRLHLLCLEREWQIWRRMLLICCLLYTSNIRMPTL